MLTSVRFAKQIRKGLGVLEPYIGHKGNVTLDFGIVSVELSDPTTRIADELLRGYGWVRRIPQDAASGVAESWELRI